METLGYDRFSRARACARGRTEFSRLLAVFQILIIQYTRVDGVSVARPSRLEVC